MMCIPLYLFWKKWYKAKLFYECFFQLVCRSFTLCSIASTFISVRLFLSACLLSIYVFFSLLTCQFYDLFDVTFYSVTLPGNQIIYIHVKNKWTIYSYTYIIYTLYCSRNKKKSFVFFIRGIVLCYIFDNDIKYVIVIFRLKFSLFDYLLFLTHILFAFDDFYHCQPYQSSKYQKICQFY